MKKSRVILTVLIALIFAVVSAFAFTACFEEQEADNQHTEQTPEGGTGGGNTGDDTDEPDTPDEPDSGGDTGDTGDESDEPDEPDTPDVGGDTGDTGDTGGETDNPENPDEPDTPDTPDSGTGGDEGGDAGGDTDKDPDVGEGGDSGHTHNFNSWHIKQPATCTEEGIMSRECDCGEEETSSIQPNGHSYGEWRELTEATCTTDGEKIRICTECSDEQREKTEKTGHVFGESLVFDGVEHYHRCEKCSVKTDAARHDFGTGDKCTACGCLRGMDDLFVFGKNQDGRSYSITQLKDRSIEKVTIPDEYEGLPVTGIGIGVFSGWYVETPTPLKEITLGKNIKRLEESAFWNCANLTSIELPGSLEYIGKYAFSRCTSLSDVTFGDSLVTIDNEGFWGCSSLRELTLPASVEYVGMYAFSGCTGLKNITFGGNLEFIGREAFYNCNKLVSADLGNGALTISDFAFAYCSSLADLTIGDNVVAVNFQIFYDAGANINYTVKNGVKYLGNPQNPYAVAFAADDKEMTELNLQDGTRIIADRAFSGCTSLLKVNLGENLRTVCQAAFSGCEALSEITFGPNLTRVDRDVFNGIRTLKKLNIADVESYLKVQFAVGENGGNYFNDCSSPIYNGGKVYLDGREVTQVTVPNTITKISPYAFAGWEGLTEVHIGAGVAQIGEYAFTKCPALKTITVSVQNEVFEGGQNCILVKSDGKLIAGCYNSEIPLNTKSIGNYAFYGVDLTAGESGGEITIPDKVAAVGAYAFYDCKLTKITVGTGLKSIATWAFSTTGKIEETWIKDAESWCAVDIADEGAMPFDWGTTVYVGGVCITDYTPGGLKIPSTVTEIKPYAFYNLSIHELSLPAETVKIDATSFGMNCNMTTVFVDGDNPAYEMSENNVGIIEKSTRTLIIGENCINADFSRDNIKIVGDYAFSGKSMSKVILPEGVTVIGERAFYNSNIKSITLPSTVVRIEKGAFENARYLSTVSIPDKTTYIGDSAFSSCVALSEIDLNKVEYIGEQAFFSCDSLRSIYIPESVRFIDENAFLSCDGLTSAEFAVKEGWIMTYTFDGTASTPDLGTSSSALNALKTATHTLKRAEE